MKPHSSDNYTRQERSEYNAAYYKANRERINAQRTARRHLCAASVLPRHVALHTDIPPEAQEDLFAFLQNSKEETVTIASTLSKDQLRSVFTSAAKKIVLRNSVSVRRQNVAQNVAQNLVNTSPET
jgi:FMN phosphatase YigB (HAD superfamily)